MLKETKDGVLKWQISASCLYIAAESSASQKGFKRGLLLADARVFWQPQMGMIGMADLSKLPLQEEVLPARRVSKSKDATPVVSDSEEAPEPADASQPPNAPQSHAQTQPAAKKGKLRKAAATQQDELQEQGSARKQSSSRTPEPSEAVQQPASSHSQVWSDCWSSPDDVDWAVTDAGLLVL